MIARSVAVARGSFRPGPLRPALPWLVLCLVVLPLAAAGCSTAVALVSGEGGFAQGCTDRLRIVYEPSSPAEPQKVYAKKIEVEFKPGPRDGMQTDGGPLERWLDASSPFDYTMPHMVVCGPDKVMLTFGMTGKWTVDFVPEPQKEAPPSTLVESRFEKGVEGKPGTRVFGVKQVPGYSETPPPVQGVAPLPAQQVQPATLQSKCNLRAQPGAQSALLGVIPAGSPVALKDRRGTWYLTDFAGKTGWVSATCFGR